MNKKNFEAFRIPPDAAAPVQIEENAEAETIESDNIKDKLHIMFAHNKVALVSAHHYFAVSDHGSFRAADRAL